MDRSELLLVLHVHVAARQVVLRVEHVVRGRVRDRRVLVPHVVQADHDGALPRRVVAELDVVVGGGAHVVFAVLGIRAVVAQRTTQQARLGHPRLVTQAVVDAEITIGPVDVQVGTDAPVRILVEVTSLATFDLRVFRGLGFPLAQIGAVEGDGELADRGFRQAIQDAQIPAFHLVRCQVLQRHVDVGDGVALGGSAVGRVTGDQAAVGCLLSRRAAVAVVHDVLDRRTGDGVLDLDLPPVQGDVQAGHEARAPHQAQRLAGRGFRLQVRVGLPGERFGGLGGTGLRHAVIVAGIGLHEASRNTLGNTLRQHCTGRAIGGRARVSVGFERVAVTCEQVADARRAEAFRVVTADHQVVDRLPAEAKLVVGGVAEVAVLRVAGCRAEVEQLGARQVSQHRDRQFQEELVQVIAALGRLGAVAGAQARSNEGVRIELAGFLAVLVARGERQGTCRQLGDFTGDVGVVALGHQVGGVVGGERGVVDGTLADRAFRTQRIDRHAARDDVATRSGNAHRHATTKLGRTIGVAQVGQVEQAICQVVLVSLVVAVADVPVEVAIGEFEEAFETTVEVPVLDVLVERTAAALVEATVDAGQVFTGRVVHAVLAQAHASDGHGGQQLLGLALVVHRLGAEGDVVGDVVRARCEQRGALLRGQQVVVRCSVVAVDIGVERRFHAVDLDIALVIAQVGARHAGAALAVEERRATGGDLAIASHDLVFLHVGDTQHHRRTVGGGADGEVGRFAFAVTSAVLALVEVGFRAIEVLLGDDVHHAGDRVRTVDGRCTVLQDVDALDHRGRDGVQIDAAIQAGGPAAAVDQHQGARRTEVAQADAGRTITTVVERTVQGGTVGGNALQDVGDRGHALLFDIGAGQAQDRLRGFDVGALDARTGDRDAVKVGRFLGLGGGSGRHTGNERDQNGIAQLVGLEIHWLSLSKKSWLG
ncbi:hypothetical protein SMJ63A_80168 [Stenotrophomonas geniculata]